MADKILPPGEYTVKVAETHTELGKLVTTFQVVGGEYDGAKITNNKKELK